MKKLLTVALLFALANAGAQKTSSTADRRLANIDTSLTRLLKDWHAAGFAVAVVEKNKIIYSKGFGYRDLVQKKPVTPTTLFAIGSCTKAFTASMLGMLQKEGKVSLDKKATEYLPALHFYNDKMDDGITLRDMMCHRTGLSRHDLAWYFFNTPSRDTLLQRVRYFEPDADLRSTWQYNNFMFLVQGMITEKLTGKSWEQNVRDRIFTPLGMSRSNFSIADLTGDADASLGYTTKNDTIIKRLPYYHIDGMGPAGSINSSVNEMANWVITWINNGSFNGKEIIPAAYRNQAISSQMVIGGAVPEKENPDIYFSNYGLAWFLSSYRGHYRVEHGGNIDGFSASTSFFPSDSIGIIVLSNQNNSVVPALARNLIADRLFQLKYIDWSGSRKRDAEKAGIEEKKMDSTKTSSRIAGTHPSHVLTAYAGLYTNPGYGTLEVYYRNDSLFAHTSTDSMWLRRYHYDTYEAKGIDPEDGIDTSEGGLRINFFTGESGSIEKAFIGLEGPLKPIEFKYEPKPKAITKQELERYTGEYELPGATVKVYLKTDILYLAVPGQGDYEMIPLGDHNFQLKAAPGITVKFNMDANNAVTSLTSTQPNGIFTADKKIK